MLLLLEMPQIELVCGGHLKDISQKDGGNESKDTLVKAAPTPTQLPAVRASPV